MSIVDKHNKIVSEDYFYLEDIFEKPKCSGDDLCQDCPDGYLYVDADNGEGLQCYNHRHLNALVHYKNTQIKNYSLHGPNYQVILIFLILVIKFGMLIVTMVYH